MPLRIIASASVVLFQLVQAANAQTTRPARPAVPAWPQWEDAARARKLDVATIEQLRRDGLAISGEQATQMYILYGSGAGTLFITSDSILHAYNVLLQESVQRLEMQRVPRLRELLRHVWDGLPNATREKGLDPAHVPAALERSQIVIGVALKLLGERDLKPPEKVAAIIDAEAQKVLAARAREMPAWLGEARPGLFGIDYPAFKPRGFYTARPELEAYFRATAWLQAVPFRADRPEELLSMALMGWSLRRGGDWDTRQRLAHFFKDFATLIGPADDPDLGVVMEKIDYHPALIGLRVTFEKRPEPQVGDLLRVRIPGDKTPEPVTLRVLSAAVVPDAVLMDRLMSPRYFERPRVPSGLELTAAMGSQFAAKHLAEAGQQRALEVIEQHRALFAGRNRPLYGDYLHCLSALLDAPDRDAPPLFGSQAWQAKSCQTVLGGWVQTRHTYVLQIKQVRGPIFGYGPRPPPPGFVEPDPEFFSRLADLSERTGDFLEQGGAFKLDRKAAAADARKLADLIERTGLVAKGWDGVFKLPPDEQQTFWRLTYLIEAAGIPVLPVPEGFGAELEQDIVPRLRTLVKELESNAPLTPLHQRAIGTELAPLWRKLTRTARRLESMAHKQLRGVALNEAEVAFMRGYGEVLKSLTLGNLDDPPRDDCPRVVDVADVTAIDAQTPEAARARPLRLHAAIARPRAIYVLYPYEGRPILCRGGVFPYHEFTHPDPLTDSDWRQMLDKGQAPPVPQWVNPIFAPATPAP